MLDITPGRYRHYRGGLYDVLCIATDVNHRSREFVIYRSVEFGTVWARTVFEWTKPAIVDGKTVPRYVPVAEDATS